MCPLIDRPLKAMLEAAKGTAEDAIAFAIEHGKTEPWGVTDFLTDWQKGDLTPWPEYLDWLAQRYVEAA